MIVGFSSLQHGFWFYLTIEISIWLYIV